MLDQLDIAIGFATIMLGVSLMITTLTQALLALMDMRGRNLRNGLRHLLENVAPDLRTRAQDLGERIVRHPLISDSATGRGLWGRATALTRDELLPILDDVLKDSGVKPGGLADLAEEQRRAITQWFDSAMSRTSQWFVMYSRWVTVALAVVVAFALHLDSLAMLQQLRSDRDVRSRLQAISGTLLEQSPGIVAQTERVRDAYVEILGGLVQRERGRFRQGATLEPHDRPESREQALRWIEDRASTPEDTAVLGADFTRTLDARLQNDLQRALDRFNSTRADLAATGLTIFPGNDHTYADLSVAGPHFWGILASILLLSLGAPFWFNVLKNLSSLRTVVAQRAGPAADAGTERARGVSGTPLPALPAR